MEDIATLAVEAALDAGATYADARVMEIRTEAMSARNGVVEALDREERAGVGVRALIGSSWGFFAVPDVGSAAARRAGEQAAAVARASTLVAGKDLGLAPETPVTGHWESECREDPWSVGLAEKGDLLAGRDRDDARRTAPTWPRPAIRIWDTRKWFVSCEGTQVDQHIVEMRRGDERDRRRRAARPSGGATRASAASTAPAAGSWSASWTCPGNAARIAEEARALLDAPTVPVARRDGPDPRQRADGAPDPRVGRPRHGAGPDPRLGGGLRRDLLARPAPARLAALRLGADEHHRRRDAARRARLLRLRRRGHARRTRSTSSGTASGSGCCSGRDSAAAGRARPVRRRGPRRRLRPAADGADDQRRPAARRPHTLEEIDRRHRRRDLHGHQPLVVDRRQAAELPVRLRDRLGDQGRQARRGCCRTRPTPAISPRFWGSMDMLGDRDEWTFWGTPNCGKGQPSQIGHTGHPAVPARFRGIRVGVRG